MTRGAAVTPVRDAGDRRAFVALPYALLCKRILDEGRALGYDWGEAGWVLEDNLPMRNALERMGFERYKTYRVYERPL